MVPLFSNFHRGNLRELWDELVVVDELSSGDEENLALLRRPELGVTFSKLHAWKLERYSKCVFLDADTLVLTNVDELFEREELSAAPDVGWPDMFNSGVFVFCPSSETFLALKELAKQEGSYDGEVEHRVNYVHTTLSMAVLPKFLPCGYDSEGLRFVVLCKSCVSIQPKH